MEVKELLERKDVLIHTCKSDLMWPENSASTNTLAIQSICFLGFPLWIPQDDSTIFFNNPYLTKKLAVKYVIHNIQNLLDEFPLRSRDKSW